MVSATAARGPLISAWSTVSPWGLHGADFAAGLRSGRRADTPLVPEEWSVPFRDACLVPDFDIKRVLGRKGTRSMDRATGLAVTALRHLLADDGPDSGSGGTPDGGSGDDAAGAGSLVGGTAAGSATATATDGGRPAPAGGAATASGGAGRLPGVGEDTGLALGTSTGSAQSIMDFTRDSLVSERPFFVDPARFPNTVMNCAAGQSAIWHRLKGPNTTVAGGRASGLLALQYALRLQRAGRATTVLCGAVEEFSRARAWLEWHSRGGAGAGALLGEGAAVWLLEPAESAAANGRRGLAEVAGLEFGFAADPDEVRAALADVVRRLLDRTGTAADELWVVADSGAPDALGDAERAGLADALDPSLPPLVSAADSIGDTYAASAAFQVAAVLSLAERRGLPGVGGLPDRPAGEAAPPAGGPGGCALVTSVDRDGVVGAALLRTG